MKIENRRSVMMDMSNEPLHKPSDFIEVTEWTNGEGYDITISNKKPFSIHYTEFKAIKKLIKFLEKND